MRKTLLFAFLMLASAPAAAQPMPMQLPPELTDPAATMKLAHKLQVLSQALMNIRVGEAKAALEGREARRDERNLTVGDLVRKQDPNFDRDVARQVATAGPKIQGAMQAMNRALPEIARSIDDAQRSVERAVANMPDPTYPRR